MVSFFCLILHGHLPFVRHSEIPECLEENWFFEAVTEVYLPLLGSFRRLQDEKVDFRLGFSLSPTLTAMMDDPLLKSRYRLHLENLIRLSESEKRRTAGSPELNRLAAMYEERFLLCRRLWKDLFQEDLIAAFRDLHASGNLELITTAATHGFLPLMENSPEAMRAQVEIGCRSFENFFGERPRGFWLPECGYVPALDKILARAGVRYTMLETHGLLHADPTPSFGPYALARSPEGIVLFGRDPEAAHQVWSRTEGYPGDPWYRDFYRDIGFDLEQEYLKPFLYHGGQRMATGIKYHRITGSTDRKELYDPAAAAGRVQEHARDFLSKRRHQAERLSGLMERPPVIAAMYDAELFGHWWFEGPAWLEQVFRKAQAEGDRFTPAAPSDLIEKLPPEETVSPQLSTWGLKGYNEMWLQPANTSMYRHLELASRRMKDLARRTPDAHGITERALNQALRELLLAQASDWAFLLAAGTAVAYAARRWKLHIARFNQLEEMLRNAQEIDDAWLSSLEEQDNPFPFVDYKLYR